MNDPAPLPRPLEPGLYIVATPIGNLRDITLRAIDTLRACAGVACEDTRVTGKLLKHLEISKPLWRYDDHSEARDRARLVESMQTRAVALVSDAGTPLVSDPGFRLVNDARDAGVAVTVVPGACAAIAGLAVSGMPNDRFLFAGFLPVKDKARRDALAEFATLRASLVFFETAPRLGKALAAIAEALPGREVAVARELTKLHEECRRGPPGELAAWYDAHPPRGEIVLVIAPFAADTAANTLDDAGVDALLRALLRTEKPSRAAAAAAQQTGRERKALYARALELRGE